jgi:hypothetical protein
MPKVGKEVITPDGPGVVWDLNIIKETVRVRIQKGDSSELKDYPVTEIQRPGQQNAPVVKEEEPEEIIEVTPELEAIAGEEAHERQPKQPKPKRERSEQKRERKEKPAQQNAEGDKAGKPVQRENPSRKQKDEGENRGEGKGERNERRRQPKPNPAQPKQIGVETEKKDNAEVRQEVKPDVKVDAKPETKPEVKAEAKPEASSPWKAAVERALRAAQGEE